MTTTELAQELPRIDVRCYAGRPLEIVVPVLDGAGLALDSDGMPTARAHVRASVGDPTVLHSFGSEEDPADISIADGELTITATSDITTDWALLWPGAAPETVAWWDVEITDIDGATWQITAPGTFTVVHQVTR
jgi:hypothetical protein